ncbi:hypothetical protein [Streptomyces prasinus]
MPKPYPKEFREDVVRVARNREPGVTLEQIAADFGVHPITLNDSVGDLEVPRTGALMVRDASAGAVPDRLQVRLRDEPGRPRLSPQRAHGLP